MLNKIKVEKIYQKSIKVLKQVQLPNGGILATPKGERYPYIYPRDHAIVILGFLSAGLIREAKNGLRFILRSLLKNGAFPQRIDIKGRDASYKPIQIDGTGLILYALGEYVEKADDKRFVSNYWDKIKKAVSYISQSYHEDKQLIFTPNSIHEFPPTEEGLEIWANSVCYAALVKMYQLCELLNHEHLEWDELARNIKSGIEQYLWNSRLQTFIKNIRLKESSSVLTDVDASSYAVGDFGILDDDDERVRKTIKSIEKNLWNKDLGGICRYPKYDGRHNGGWGPWPHFTLIIARHYIRLKNKKKADKYLNWVIKISWQDLLPEHISTVSEFEEYISDFTDAGLLRKDRSIMIKNARKHPMFKKGIAYITTPLAWPHAEFIRTWNLYKKIFNVS